MLSTYPLIQVVTAGGAHVQRVSVWGRVQIGVKSQILLVSVQIIVHMMIGVMCQILLVSVLAPVVVIRALYLIHLIGVLLMPVIDQTLLIGVMNLPVDQVDDSAVVAPHETL